MTKSPCYFCGSGNFIGQGLALHPECRELISRLPSIGTELPALPRELQKEAA